jgi:hypothetical protein
MCKEMPVILVNKVVDPKRIIRKRWRAKEEERHKGLLTPPPRTKKERKIYNIASRPKLLLLSHDKLFQGLVDADAALQQEVGGRLRVRLRLLRRPDPSSQSGNMMPSHICHYTYAVSHMPPQYFFSIFVLIIIQVTQSKQSQRTLSHYFFVQLQLRTDGRGPSQRPNPLGDLRQRDSRRSIKEVRFQ